MTTRMKVDNKGFGYYVPILGKGCVVMCDLLLFVYLTFTPRSDLMSF